MINPDENITSVHSYLKDIKYPFHNFLCNIQHPQQQVKQHIIVK